MQHKQEISINSIGKFLQLQSSIKLCLQHFIVPACTSQQLGNSFKLCLSLHVAMSKAAGHGGFLRFRGGNQKVGTHAVFWGAASPWNTRRWMNQWSPFAAMFWMRTVVSDDPGERLEKLFQLAFFWKGKSLDSYWKFLVDTYTVL